MRHVATIQPHPDKLPQLVGIGESGADALSGARAWFSQEFDRTNSKDWFRLIALQDTLADDTEDEFAAKTGVGLDDWLARMTAAGTTPAKAAPVPAVDANPPLPALKGNNSSQMVVIYCALSVLIFVGILAGVKYGGTRILNREIESISRSNNSFDVGSGPAFDSAIGTIDPDDLWGGLYGTMEPDTSIDGVMGP